MRIAMPVSQGEFSLYYSNCDQFAIVEVGAYSKTVLDAEYMTPMSFDLKTLPIWLHENDVDVIVAGGMPQEIKDVFIQNHIDVQVGFLYGSVKAVLAAFLDTMTRSDGTTNSDGPRKDKHEI